jgi:hypothetical protein
VAKFRGKGERRVAIASGGVQWDALFQEFVREIGPPVSGCAEEADVGAVGFVVGFCIGVGI